MDESSTPTTFSIVIVGSRSSGKNTFIKAVSEIEVVNRIKDNNDPTLEILGINVDFGRVMSEDGTVVLYLFGIRLLQRYDFMLDTLTATLNRTVGFIVMVDSSHSETIRETQWIAQIATAYTPIPIVIAANFQDSPDAWDVEALRIGLRLPNDIPIIPCVATDRESVKGVIIALLNEVLKGIRPSRKSRKNPPHG